MKTYWFAALCVVVLVFGATGCGTPRQTGERRGKWRTQETGSLLPRWIEDPRGDRDTRQRRAKAKRERRVAKKKADKPKRERQERRRSARDEEVITRGGFR